MKTWEIQGFGLENLNQATRPIPQPGTGQLLVKVSAVSLNFRDKAIIDGIYLPHLMKMPIVPVSDFAGTVVAIGNGITKFKEGDRVMSTMFPTWTTGMRHPSDVSLYALGGAVDGGLAEYALLSETGVVRSPDSLSDSEAATLPIAALTAWSALIEHGQLKSGQTVVTQGTGGVALFAAQLAIAMGARVISLTGSQEKQALLKQLGASDIVNYNLSPEWQEKVLELTGGNGADNIIDIVGGGNLNRSVQAVANGGQVSVIGFLGGTTASLDLLPVIFKAAQVRGVLVGSTAAFERLVKFIADNQIKPVIEKTYSFDEAVQAYRHLEKGAVGKVVIKIDGK
ncbi:NAD(P)-dependent alcohol dehydrogenase [Chitinophaga agrisoli]|uniref:NAD(P)-dependent alcohol dehydrogenase n=1 Tax=Chitinophaga agrisoli TaxID=2607653 RepID=A0A5B2VWV3_9BACT|nr:NAD(P)-dependent alcohol dehydrogenase [Chitinophaga agrisoli]KAA2242727.1 NAD(P)-dependent alcohol dehydrogenase [Chitinophaga agrisoli]